MTTRSIVLCEVAGLASLTVSVIAVWGNLVFIFCCGAAYVGLHSWYICVLIRRSRDDLYDAAHRRLRKRRKHDGDQGIFSGEL